MKEIRYTHIFLIILVLLLSSCKSKSGETPTSDPHSIYTMVAQTVAVKLTAKADNNLTSTISNTGNMVISTQPESTLPVSITSPQATAAATIQNTEDQAEYDYTEPKDGTIFSPGESFSVTWKVTNIGKTTWSTSYQIRFFSGDRMGSGLSNAYSFPETIEPGGSIELTADFIAPSKTGTYKSIWVLTNADGVNFYPVYIEISVKEPTSTPTITPTETANPAEFPTVTNTP